MTIRTAALGSIAIAIVFAACGGGDDYMPTATDPIATRPANPLTLCFDESVLPVDFAVTSDLVLDEAEQGLAELYGEWGRITGGKRTYSREFRYLETAPETLLDGRFHTVACTVELYEDADGASRAFEGTGFHGALLPGTLDRGTFRVVASPKIGTERRQYLSVHAVISASDVLFRTGNFLARVHVEGPTSSFAGAEKNGLVAEAARLALVLLDRIERESTG